MAINYNLNAIKDKRKVTTMCSEAELLIEDNMFGRSRKITLNSLNHTIPNSHLTARAPSYKSYAT